MGKALTKLIQMGQSRPSGALVGYINVMDIRDRRLLAGPLVVSKLEDWGRGSN